MNENTLYYTFSTVAQMLASAYGVMAAVVLFKLSATAVDSSMKEAAVKWMKLGFMLTAWTIAICVIALPLVPVLVVHGILAGCVVAIVVLSSLGCGFFYYFLAVSQIPAK